MERRLSALVVASALSILASACGTSPPATTTSATAGTTSPVATTIATSPAITTDTPSSGTTAKASSAVVPADVLAKVCSDKDTDAASQIFVAYKGDTLHRLVVTPTRDIPDMGNLVFDASGNRLGEEVGSEFPWENKELAAEEHARMTALMDGAIERQNVSASCR